jgi:hypothetical protein
MHLGQRYKTLLLQGGLILLLAGCAFGPSPSEGDRAVSPREQPTPTVPTDATEPDETETTDQASGSDADSTEAAEDASGANPKDSSQAKDLSGATPSRSLDASSQPISAAPGETITVTLYKADPLCEEFVAEQVEVNSQEPLEALVGRAIANQNTADFRIAGYRVSMNDDTNTATVDFRLAPDSRRGMTSLSTCEQFALFGSIEESLTSNSRWDIDAVQFTEQGEEILL